MSAHRVDLWPQVQAFYAELGMSYRRDVKRALRELQNSRGDIKALGESLEGYHRLRVGPYRILFRYRPGKIIECVYMNRRALVYEVFEREVIDKLRGDRA